MTSFFESFGIVLVEAESYGVPLIAYSSAQGANEIIENNKNGFLIENRDKGKMALTIIKLIEDIELRKRLGQVGIEMSKKYSKEAVKGQWLNFIGKIFN